MKDVYEPLVTAVRVFTTRQRHQSPPDQPEPRTKRRYPYEALVFDTETTTDPTQRLLFGVWRFYRDDPDGAPGVTCVEEGLFYPDDLRTQRPAEFETLMTYAETHETDAAAGFAHAETGRRLLCWPLSRWLEDRLHEYGYKHRNRCDVVGFNLFFDLTRLASHWGEGRHRFYGGWSLGLIGTYDRRGKWSDDRFHPRLNAKAIDPRRTLFGWGTLAAEDRDNLPAHMRGRFVDLRTLAFALTDKSHTLESACEAFGDPYEKAKVPYGTITTELVRYAREDVEHTANLYRGCLEELAHHTGVELQPHKLYSPATVGVRYFEAMGLAQPIRHFKLDPRIHGWAMSAFYGGRAEARIVRTPVPIAYVDATSMYPTVNALLGTWNLLTAKKIRSDDSTDDVRHLLADPNLYDRCYDRQTWSEGIGVTLVELDNPDGAILPVRGEYDETSLDPGIGVNPLRYRGRIWYTLPDVMASTILTGHPPAISRAIRLRPDGAQTNLKAIPLRGGTMLDPREDPFVAMIELRHIVKNDQSIAQEERDRLDQFLKITANASSYGSLARFDRRRYSTPKTTTVYGPDRPFKTQTHTPEDPGPYTFPPIAASITGAARLMLAMLEHAVAKAGGAYAFCDTDSMGIVCHPSLGHVDAPTPDGTDQIPTLQPDTVRDILARFEPLNPYNPELVPRLWKEEHDSLADPLWCYAISAKRYALYRTIDTGVDIVDVMDDTDLTPEDFDPQPTTTDERQLVDWSEHGIGIYLDPTGPDAPRDDEGRRIWVRQAWEWILTADGDPDQLPPWADRYALSRFSLSSPAVANWFAGYNRNKPSHKQIRPATFGLIAHPDPLTPQLADNRDRGRPAAPYDPDPDSWPGLPWYDRASHKPATITTLTPRQDPEQFTHLIRSGAIRVNTIGDMLAAIRTRPEHKSRAPDGQPSTGATRGLLQRRPIETAPVITDLIGKEGNQLEERATGAATDPEEYRSNYGSRTDRFNQLVIPVLREMGVDEVMRRTGKKKSAVYDVLAGNLKKRGAPASRYRDAAAGYASERLKAQRVRVPRHSYGALYRWLTHRE